jgi:hypothetical protein
MKMNAISEPVTKCKNENVAKGNEDEKKKRKQKSNR